MAIFITAAPAPVGFKHSFLKGPFSAASVRKHSRKQARAHASAVLTKDPYTTLGLPAGASKEEIKKARRRLALKFHPDVCKGDSCAAKFIQIEQAYETIMDCLSGQKDSLAVESCYNNVHEGMMGVNDDSWEDWEEWMGWEGAGTRDYSSHINHAL